MLRICIQMFGGGYSYEVRAHSYKMSEELPRVEKPNRLVITEESLSEPPPQPSAPRSPMAQTQPQALLRPQLTSPGAAVSPPAPALPALDSSSKEFAPGSRSFCSACGRQIDPRAMVCPNCGVAAGGALAASAAMAALTMRHKSTGMAILLSLFLPGAGQFYVGRTGRGIAFFCAAVVSYVLIIVLIGLILVPAVVIWAAVDANKLANAYNAQLLAGVPLT